jgi:hypothetical protein
MVSHAIKCGQAFQKREGWSERHGSLEELGITVSHEAESEDKAQWKDFIRLNIQRHTPEIWYGRLAACLTKADRDQRHKAIICLASLTRSVATT